MGSQFQSSVFIALLFLSACGSEASSIPGSDNQSQVIANTKDNNSQNVLIQKLLGTPFEAELQTIQENQSPSGDHLDPRFFLCENETRTDLIDAFPIPIFAAFFTAEEEKEILAGIQLTNDAIGYEAYQLQDVWHPQDRVIVKVKDISKKENAVGRTEALLVYFGSEAIGSTQASDWYIDLKIANRYIVAHELGHASGLIGHAFVDYENRRIFNEEENGGLEENSIMQAKLDLDLIPTLNDYQIMMEVQGDIMQDYLGEDAPFVIYDPCDSYEVDTY